MKKLLNGKYEVLNRIKSGGFSTVYLAKDIRLDMRVVLKQFHQEEMAGKLQGKERAKKYSVENEIKTAIHFNHPNIGRYFDFFTLEEEDAFGTQNYEVGVMEYISGGSLKEYITQKGIKSEEAKLALLGVLEGLKYLHDRNMIHRDVKPDNILMSDGVAKIIDFGISKRLQEAQTRKYEEGERQSELITTFEYCSPEQIDPYTFGVNGTISHTVDVWMFGVMVYYLATGKFPFGSTSNDIARENLRKNILSLEAETIDWTNVPLSYKSIIQQCLAKKAKDRPSVSEAIKMFKSSSDFAKEEPQTTEIITTPESPKSKSAKSLSSRKVLYYVGMPLIICIIIILAYNYYSHEIDQKQPSGLELFENDEKYGYVNADNEIVIPAKFEKASSFDHGVATVHVNDSILKINEKGDVVEVIQPRDVDTSEDEVSTDQITESMNSFIDQFNEQKTPSYRLKLIRSHEANFDNWSDNSSIFALNDLNEASLKSVFFKAIERDKNLNLESIQLDKKKNKILYALFTMSE